MGIKESLFGYRWRFDVLDADIEIPSEPDEAYEEAYKRALLGTVTGESMESLEWSGDPSAADDAMAKAKADPRFAGKKVTLGQSVYDK